jgi:hypothetical protein
MSLLNYIVEKLKSGAITFVNAVTLANRDYPYHDYYDNDEYEDKGKYTVGENQLHGHGDQRKYFVSKSTLVYCTDIATIHFNNANNVPIVILANTWYEFKSNIYQVFWNAIDQGKYLYLYFEGVLSNEQRGAE